MHVQARNVALIGSRHRFLRLDDFQIIRHARRETVFGLIERLLRQVDRTASRLDLIGRGCQIKQRAPHLEVNPSPQILYLGPGLPQGRFRLQNVRVHFAALKDRNPQRATGLEGAMRIARG